MKLYCMAEICTMTNRSQKWLRKWIKRGEIPEPSQAGERNKKLFTEDDTQKIIEFSQAKQLRRDELETWSRKHDKCQLCGTKETPHGGNGLCQTCYNKTYLSKYREANKEKLSAQKKNCYRRKHGQYLVKLKERRELDNFDGNREKALERDNHSCVICNSNENVVVHHIDGRGRGVGKEERNNALKNLITLCRVCHPKVHAGTLKI